MKAQTLDLSVAMPAHNTGEPIKKAVLSLLENLRGFNYEIVIVNDGSTDNTGKILRRLARQYPVIRVQEQANQGAGSAKRAALALCRGRYVWIRDSNDEVPAGAFAGFDQNLLRGETDLFIFDYVKSDDQGLPLGMLRLDHDIYRGLPPGPFDPSTRPELLCTSHFTWNKFYRRAWLEEHGIANAALRAHDDIIIHAKTLCLARSGRYEARAVLRDVSYAGQLSGRPELRLAALEALAEAEAFMDSLPPSLARRTAWRVFQANHLYWVYNNCGQAREPVRKYYEAFLLAIPRAELLDFAKHPWLRLEVMRYALELRGLSAALGEKLLRPSPGRKGGLLAGLSRLWAGRP